MVSKLRILGLALVVLAPARLAHATDINITIQGDLVQPSQSESAKQYRRGREFDEMTRKGYICYREAGSSDCYWAKPEGPTRPHWGECTQSEAPLKGRWCERILPDYSRWFYDFERPLVLLGERTEQALDRDPDAERPATRKILGAFEKKAKEVAKKLNDEQLEVLQKHFGGLFKRVGLDYHAVSGPAAVDRTFGVSVQPRREQRHGIG